MDFFQVQDAAKPWSFLLQTWRFPFFSIKLREQFLMNAFSFTAYQIKMTVSNQSHTLNAKSLSFKTVSWSVWHSFWNSEDHWKINQFVDDSKAIGFISFACSVREP